jgi:hypothetical protein
MLYRSARSARPVNECLTSQKLRKLYRDASRGDQRPVAPDECRKAPEAAPGSGHDRRLSPQPPTPRSGPPGPAVTRVQLAPAERPDLADDSAVVNWRF